MQRDIGADEFSKLSKEGQKRYVVNLLIRNSEAKPVEDGQHPVAIIMAGIPGAGKTEFLQSYMEKLSQDESYGNLKFVDIDLDQIVSLYPEYTPKTDKLFRSQGNLVVARCVDALRKGRYNMLIDGTFSGKSGASITNVGRLLDAGYAVLLVFMYDRAEVAWQYTQSREVETERGIDKAGFLESCSNVFINIREAVKRFKKNEWFDITIVKQKELRIREYDIIDEDKDIDTFLKQGYNIEELERML
jgi:predicted ABC-type ATPase